MEEYQDEPQDEYQKQYLLDKLERNLKPYAKVTQVIRHVEYVKDTIKRFTFGILAEDMNIALKAIGIDSSFSVDDFNGAKIYPTETEWYIKRHVLPPLSFGVFIPKRNWPIFVDKLRLSLGKTGQCYDPQVFKGSNLELDKCGLTLHKEGSMTDEEYEIVYCDNSLYNDLFGKLKVMTTSRLENLFFAQICFDHQLFAFMNALRVEEMSEIELVNSLHNYAWQLIEIIPYSAGYPEKAKSIFANHFKGTLERIEPAIKAMSDLENRLDRFLTPVMFSCGAVLHEKTFISDLPTADIIRWSQSDVLREDIEEIIEKKGYDYLTIS